MPIEITDTPLAGLKRIQLDMHRDDRGFFVERFQHYIFAGEGLPTRFAQVNHSRSLPGVLRGLHFQHKPPQGKLMGVISGAVWDVVLDIRPWSQTFGQYYAEELSGDNGVMLFIPVGFAHGFCVIGEMPADLLYQTTEYYEPEGEGGICFNDRTLNISWPVKYPVVSQRDQNLPDWSHYCANPPHWGQ